MVSRFMLDDAGELIDLNNHKFVDYGDECCNLLNELHEENSKLHIQLDFLKDENQHMRKLVNENRQLKERNNRQAKQLDNLYTLIEKQD